jgi:transcription elongation GreA/GreB family factor
VRITDLEKSDTREYVISFPGDCDTTEGALSILDPLGAAVLGALTGDTVGFERNGSSAEAHIDEVLYQQVDYEFSC